MLEGFDAELDEFERASDRPTYNTAAVEQRTGLRPATFRAWERRYGFPRPRRLPGNQRLYSDRDIAAILWLKRRTAEGLGISHAIRFLVDRPPRAQALAIQPATGRPMSVLAVELQQVLLAFDARRADALLREAFALYSLEETCLHVIQPSLVEIGER